MLTGVLSLPAVPVSSHQLVNQSKSPTLTTQAQQVLPNAAGLRLTSQQTLVTNTGHILSGQPTMITNPAMLNHLQVCDLLLFYIIATCKVISGWIPTCDSVH